MADRTLPTTLAQTARDEARALHLVTDPQKGEKVPGELHTCDERTRIQRGANNLELDVESHVRHVLDSASGHHFFSLCCCSLRDWPPHPTAEGGPATDNDDVLMAVPRAVLPDYGTLPRGLCPRTAIGLCVMATYWQQ